MAKTSDGTLDKKMTQSGCRLLRVAAKGWEEPNMPPSQRKENTGKMPDRVFKKSFLHFSV
jgi:hypothetical protein